MYENILNNLGQQFSTGVKRIQRGTWELRNPLKIFNFILGGGTFLEQHFIRRYNFGKKLACKY
jgi:hypothetical protein